MQHESIPHTAGEKTGRSSIEKLPPETLKAVDAAIGNGATIDETVALIRARGGKCSRSAVGRYAKHVRDATQWRYEYDRCAEMWLRRLGKRAEGSSALMAVEALRALTLRTMSDLAEAKEQEPAPVSDIFRLALALRQIEGADKSRSERERATAEAEARATGGPPYSKGLSDEAVAIIRRAVECEFSR